MDKKTPLYDTHVKYGGKIVPFGGFLLPIQYETGIKQETWQFVQHAVYSMYPTWVRFS